MFIFVGFKIAYPLTGLPESARKITILCKSIAKKWVYTPYTIEEFNDDVRDKNS